MSETEHEHDEGDEAAGAPQAVEDESEALAEEEETHDAETDAGEAAGASEGDDDAPETAGTHASAKAERDQQKAVEKMFDAFERETKRHTTRIAEIAGDSAPDLLQCPMCLPEEGQPSMPGWLLPVKPSDEKIAAIRQAIGLAPKIDYREDPHSKVCPTCGGLKSVVPAGIEAAAMTLPCADCKAQGWLATDEVRGGVSKNGEATQSLQTGPLAPPTLEPDSPEVAALKAQGYTVIAPYTMPAS